MANKKDEKGKAGQTAVAEPASTPAPDPPLEEPTPPPAAPKSKKKVEEVKRHPLKWAELLGIHPDILGTFRHPVKAAGEVPAGISAAIVAGASIHHGWSRMRGKVHELTLGVAVTKAEFYALVNEWRFAPSSGTAARRALFDRRNAGLKARHNFEEVKNG